MTTTTPNPSAAEVPSAAQDRPWTDTSWQVAERVEVLLSRLTVAEKVEPDFHGSDAL